MSQNSEKAPVRRNRGLVTAKKKNHNHCQDTTTTIRAASERSAILNLFAAYLITYSILQDFARGAMS